MTNTPYTQKQFFQFRGPQNSDEYNKNQEDNFKDLSYLYNKLAQLDSDQDKGNAAFIKELLSISKFITSFDTRLSALEYSANNIAFTQETQVDTDRFNSTAFNINSVDRCTYNAGYSMLTLPKVDASSLSKIRFINDDGTYNIPASLQTYVSPIITTADNTSAVIETSQPYNAIIAEPGKVWERNVIAPSTNVNGAQMYFYVTIPNELSAAAETNCIQINPYPLNNVDILEIAYSTDVNLDLATGTNWTTFNAAQTYYQNTQAVGDIMPGGWTGDEIINSGPKTFYFTPMPITGLRFKLRQRSYYTETAKYVYSYGISKLDVRYDKFLDIGKAIIKFDAPTGRTISNITSVIPQIWNIPEYQVSDVFSYRVLWETSFNSGTYTLTPVPSSQRIWMEVTLKKNNLGATPALSGLILKYS